MELLSYPPSSVSPAADGAPRRAYGVATYYEIGRRPYRGPLFPPILVGGPGLAAAFPGLLRAKSEVFWGA